MSASRQARRERRAAERKSRKAEKKRAKAAAAMDEAALLAREARPLQRLSEPKIQENDPAERKARKAEIKNQNRDRQGPETGFVSQHAVQPHETQNRDRKGPEFGFVSQTKAGRPAPAPSGFVSQIRLDEPAFFNQVRTQSRRAINRANAQLSTGPRTPEGKLASSRNSLKHGLASGTLFIPGEDPVEFETLRNALFENTSPPLPPKSSS